MPNISFDISLWLPLLAFVLGAIAHALSADEGRSVLERFGLPPVPRSWLPYLTIAFGIGADAVNMLVLGKGWQESLIGAFFAAATTVFGLNATRVAHGVVNDGKGNINAAVILLAAAFAIAPMLGCAALTKATPYLPTPDQIACAELEADKGTPAAVVITKCGFADDAIEIVEHLLAGHKKAKAIRATAAAQ